MIHRLLLFVLLIALAATGAAQTCSNEDLRGAYLFQTNGWANPAAMGAPGPDMNIPFAGLGIVTYDGKGGGSGKFWHAAAGQLSEREFVDFKYKIEANCQGEVTYLAKDPATGGMLGPERAALTLSDDGHRLKSISVDTKTGGIVLSEQSRMDRAMPSCGADLIRGTYTMSYAGWLSSMIMNPSGPLYFMPAFGVASFNMNGEKGSWGSGTHNFGGMIFTTELKSATWEAGENCTGMVSLLARIKESNTETPTKGPYVVLEGGNRIVVLAVPYAAFMTYTRESMR